MREAGQRVQRNLSRFVGSGIIPINEIHNHIFNGARMFVNINAVPPQYIVSSRKILHIHATLGPCNTDRVIHFLHSIHDMLVQGLQNEDKARYVIIWDNVSFHCAHQVQNWFVTLPHFSVVYLPPWSPFLNPIDDFFSTWRWKVYDRRPGNGGDM